MSVDPDGISFLAVSGPSLSQSNAPPLHLRRSKTGLVRSVFGRDLRVSQQSIGCSASEPLLAATCFVQYFAGSFGLSPGLYRLASGTVRTTGSGEHKVRFYQLHEGYPVFARHIDIVLTAGLDIIGAFSTLALPFVGAPAVTSIQASQRAFAPAVARDNLRLSTKMDDLQESGSWPTIWPTLDGTRYRAVSAIAVSYESPSRQKQILGIFDAASASVLETRMLTADLPERVITGNAVHSYMTTGSNHITCSQDSECAYLGSLGICSDHFAPSNRCVASCIVDADCDGFPGYECFPVTNNPELGGYCYYKPDPFPDVDYVIYSSTTGWFNSALADHKAYSNLKDSLDELAVWVRDVCDIPSGYDGEDADYEVVLQSQCYACDQCDQEYSACGPAPAYTGFGVGPVFYNRWYGKWAWTPGSGRIGPESILGHEFGHKLVGGGYGFEGFWPLGCVSESAADIYGTLFAVERMGTTSTWGGCNGFPTDAWQDDRAGLHPGCYAEMLKSYAYRSRFDLLRCRTENVYSGSPCMIHSDCPAYQQCDTDVNECYESGDEHNGGMVFTRFVRILADGAGVLGSDGHSEISGIQDSPIGRDATARVLSKAQRSLSASADLQYWMDQVLFWAYTEGYYDQAMQALGAAGFFPNRTYLDSFTADKAPVRYNWPDYEGDDHKAFVVFINRSNVYLRYHLKGVPYRIGLKADTSFRPAIVGYRDYLHVFWRDNSSGKIYVWVLHKSGVLWYGPFLVDPGTGQLMPNGAFDVTLWQGRVYLVFGDATNSSKLSLAWCGDDLGCFGGGWHDFGGRTYKKVVRAVSIDEGPSAVGNDLIHGLAQYDDNLWIFYSELSNGRLWLSSVDTSDNLKESYVMPSYYPSHLTDGPVGIAVKASAFPGTCNTGDPDYEEYECDRNYLYLVWKDRSSNDIFTSVFQNANPARFTRSQPSFYQAKSDTGASWTRNTAPGDNIQGLYTDPSYGKPYQFNGYGRY